MSTSTETKKVIYIVIEGLDGCGKSTTVRNTRKMFIDDGKKVFETNEPGSKLSTQKQTRTLMLDKQYADEITPFARECLSQANRDIQYKKIIFPILDGNQENIDIIISDRSIISGYAYAVACG